MNQRGFTLLEVLVSATIIAVLTTIGVVAYSSVNKRSRDVKRKSDLEQVRSALEMYRSDYGEYPDSGAEAFQTLSHIQPALVDGGYLPTLPSDPDTNRNYRLKIFTANGMRSSYCICALIEGEGVVQCALPGGSETGAETMCNYSLKNP
jgi:type II secretion system protein G